MKRSLSRVTSRNLGGVTAPTFLDLRRAAEVADVQYRTMRNYHQVAERNRRLAAQYNDPESPDYDPDAPAYIKPGDLPPPDDTYGRSPVWKASTIKRWMRERPGRGVGGGRPVGWRPSSAEAAPEM